MKNDSTATKTDVAAIVRPIARRAITPGANGDVAATVRALTAIFAISGFIETVPVSVLDLNATRLSVATKLDAIANVRPIDRTKPTVKVDVAAIVLTLPASLVIAGLTVTVTASVRPKENCRASAAVNGDVAATARATVLDATSEAAKVDPTAIVFEIAREIAAPKVLVTASVWRRPASRAMFGVKVEPIERSRPKSRFMAAIKLDATASVLPIARETTGDSVAVTERVLEYAALFASDTEKPEVAGSDRETVLDAVSPAAKLDAAASARVKLLMSAAVKVEVAAIVRRRPASPETTALTVIVTASVFEIAREMRGAKLDVAAIDRKNPPISPSVGTKLDVAAIVIGVSAGAAAPAL